MDGIMNKNQLIIVKEYAFNNPLLQKVDFLIDNPLRDCHKKYFHTFDHICEYDIQLTNITNIETVHFTISENSYQNKDDNDILKCVVCRK